MTIFDVYDSPSWVTNSSKWMHPILGNVYIPGIVYLNDCGIQLKHQKAKGSGKDYGGVLLQGLEIPDFEFEIHIRTASDEKAWARVAPLYLPRKDPSLRTVLSVSHPILESYQIYNCVTVKMKTKLPNAGGPMKITLGCIAVCLPKDNAIKNLNYSKKPAQSAQPAQPPFVNISPSNFQNRVHKDGSVIGKPDIK